MVEVDSGVNPKVIGKNCTLTCNYNATGINVTIRNYTWYKGAGVEISSSNDNPNLTLTNLNIRDSVNYYCDIELSIPVLDRNVNYTSNTYLLKFLGIKTKLHEYYNSTFMFLSELVTIVIIIIFYRCTVSNISE